jgi:cytochrome d ubiquinol oxidase subunit II
MDFLDLQTLWFALIAVLWVGYFFLEGFDFGVGILSRVLARDDVDRRVIINTIGPVWDGNEVWLLVAGGATFAAFPGWYATLFSGFYLALFLILVALIVRGVAFEFRHQSHDERWTRWWDRAIFWGSLLPALLWGVGFAAIVGGTPIDASGEYVGSFFDLLTPYTLFAGLASLLLFTLHGAAYLALKTEGEVAERARRLAQRLGLVVAAGVIAFLGWTYLVALDNGDTGVVPGAVPVTAMVAILSVEWLLRERMDGWAFAMTGVTIVLVVTTLFLNLYPRVMVSSIDPAFSPTIASTSASDLTLEIMTWAALVFTPIVVLYQGWTYWVFRKRISRETITGPTQGPMDLLQERFGDAGGGSAGAG